MIHTYPHPVFFKNRIKLESGKELDKYIAEQVMAWREGNKGYEHLGNLMHSFDFHPSTDIKDAWKVLDKAMLFRMFSSLVFDSKAEMYMFVCHRYDFGPAAKTMPLAICLAALDAHLPDHKRYEIKELRVLDEMMRQANGS